jgi:hypothetical protein
MISQTLEKRIEHYGFAVENIYSWKEVVSKLILSIFIIPLIPFIIVAFIVLMIIAGISEGDFSFMKFDPKAIGIMILLSWIFGTLGIGYYIAAIFWGFIMAGRLFYSEKWQIFAWQIYPRITFAIIKRRLKTFHFLPVNSNITEGNALTLFTILLDIITYSKWMLSNNRIRFLRKILNLTGILVVPFFAIIWWPYILQMELSIIEGAWYINVVYGLFWIILWMMWIGTLLSIVYRTFNPLYAFGNIWEKIQKLTPEIESQSQLIQSELQKDMNFWVLHSGFEKLSSTFSTIVELVLKLEKTEAKANKGNLFDSAKYIGSLRADIVTPLTELKKFLEWQREQLLESQRELSRVRVGWDSEINSEPVLNSFQEWQENIELQSKRSESLLQELDSNIAALGEMVAKMG